jgi:hypothetical protein
MNKWYRYSLLKEYRERMLWENCNSQGIFKPVNELVVDGRHINLNDYAVSKFFDLMKFNPSPKTALFVGLTRELDEYLIRPLKSFDPVEDELLKDLFESRNSQDGWVELDKILNYMGGVTLAQVVDETSILINPLDDVLNGAERFHISVTIKTDNGKDHLHQSRRAIASRFDLLLPLVQKIVDSDPDVSWTFKDDNRRLVCASTKKNGYFPDLDFIEVFHNNTGVLGIHIAADKVAKKYSINWDKLETRTAGTEIISALSKFAPPRVGNRLKGKHLEDELGL